MNGGKDRAMTKHNRIAIAAMVALSIAACATTKGAVIGGGRTLVCPARPKAMREDKDARSRDQDRHEKEKEMLFLSQLQGSL